MVPYAKSYHVWPQYNDIRLYNDTQLYLVILHYNDVIMEAIASQMTSVTIVYSIVYSDADQRKHQSSASLAFVRGIHRGPVNSPHKWPVTRKMFPFDDVIMMQAPFDLCSHNTKYAVKVASWPYSTPFFKAWYWLILMLSSRLCNWLSLWRLVPWINHLPPVCWSTFWKSS